MACLYYYKLVSEYPCDVTKNCKLTINEIDSNFYQLKGDDIKTAEFVREDKTLVLTRNNGEKLIVPLKDMTYNLNVSTECGESGTTLTISYDGTEGKKTVTIGNILTAENLASVIGSEILTKVITDGTLKGLGTINSPLGIAGVEKTGMLAPALEVLDLTTGGTLPEIAKLGTRYVTKEYVNDYGYLYNGAGAEKISQRLKDIYISKNTKENERYAWRIPSKDDWDALLNSIEPCDSNRGCKEHNSAKCHVELGCVAGKYLKSECGWLGQPDCECTVTKPSTGCTYEEEDYIENTNMGINDSPEYKPESPVGVDKYGMTVLPSGVATIDSHGRPQAASFKEQAVFWTTTHIYNDCDQDIYAKIFSWNKSGVMQVAECPEPYYSVRLVKDYNGSNYYDTEYIDGVLYKTLLFPESGQIWLASNFADKDGFVEYQQGGETPEVVDVNNGDVLENRVEMFINEWNGNYWEKKIMHEGDSIVIENPCFDRGTGSTTNVCWNDKEGVQHCVDIDIEKVSQRNIEYRVFTEDEGCSKVLVNADDLVVERVIDIIVPMIEQEREERIEADEILSGAIETEREERISADTALSEEIEELRREVESATTDIWEALVEEAMIRKETDEILSGAIETEREERISADTALDEKIDAETERAISAETALDEKIDAETERAISAETELREDLEEEIERATEREDEIEEELLEEIDRAKAREDEIDGQLIDPSNNPYTLNACLDGQEPNMVLKTKDNDDEHFIKIQFDGNFGEI